MAKVVDRLVSDPLRNFKFNVVFSNAPTYGFGDIGFMSVTGLSTNTDVIPYREGGYPTTPHKLPGQSDFQPVTMSRGLAVGDEHMMKWMRDLMAVSNGATGNGDSGYDFRASVEIQVLSHPVRNGAGVVKARFKLNNAWPTTVSFSDLDAGSNQVIIQQMTLVHEGFEYSVADQSTGGVAATFSG